MIPYLLQIRDTMSQSTMDASLLEIVEPAGAFLASVLVILITFYMSNLKHDMLDDCLEEKHHKMKRPGPYAKLIKMLGYAVQERFSYNRKS
jgi:hypothetical protein